MMLHDELSVATPWRSDAVGLMGDDLKGAQGAPRAALSYEGRPWSAAGCQMGKLLDDPVEMHDSLSQLSSRVLFTFFV